MTASLARGGGRAAVHAARRVLVTVGRDLAAETVARACDLAEALGAAVDFGDHDPAAVAGPTIARIGAVTAAPEELRDRADLVVFWFCDPATEAPDFLHRFVTSATSAGRPRHTIAVGPVAVASSAAADRHLPAPRAAAVDLARLLQAAVTGHAVPPPPPALAAARDAVHAALESAACVAVVTRHGDPVGLEPWSLVGLLRAVAHRKPAFEVPLEPAGATATVCTWRYGAAGAIARADRGGAAFRPAECDAVRLVARGEVDCVIAVGRPPAAVEAVLSGGGAPPDVIRIGGDDAAIRAELDALVAGVGGRGGAGATP